MVARGPAGPEDRQRLLRLRAAATSAAYRRDVLARTLGMLRHAGLWRPPADRDAAVTPAAPTIRARVRRPAASARCTTRRAATRTAPAVLLLHQTPRSWAEYREVLPLLGAAFRAIAMDTAGFGDSDPVAAPASIEAWAGVAVRAARCAGHRARPRRGPPHRRRDRGRAGGARMRARVACAGAVVDAVHRRSVPPRARRSGRRSTRSSRAPTAAISPRCGRSARRSIRPIGPTCCRRSCSMR